MAHLPVASYDMGCTRWKREWTDLHVRDIFVELY
jgi:hypothetical protein